MADKIRLTRRHPVTGRSGTFDWYVLCGDSYVGALRNTAGLWCGYAWYRQSSTRRSMEPLAGNWRRRREATLSVVAAWKDAGR
jgi:hypothetical protein